MNIIAPIYQFFATLDEKQFIRYTSIALLILVLLNGFFIYRYFSLIATYKRRAAVINKQREEVKSLLERYEVVKKQQGEVDALLEKDKEFKIGGYFNTLMAQLGLTQNKTREPETSSQVLENGYTEIKLYASFANLNTQKLVQLLDALEQNERVYIKELEVYKPNSAPSINVNVLIATLEPKVQTIPTE